MTRPPGILGLNAKLADAAPHARVTLAALVELLARDELLRKELYAAVRRSVGFLFWSRLIPRPVLAQDAPRNAPGRSTASAQPSAQPSAPVAAERAAERAPGPVPVAAPAAAGGGLGAGVAAAAVPRRGVFGRRAPAPDDGGLAALHAAIADRLGGAS